MQDTGDVTDRFDDLEPIKSAPALFTLNGFGTSLIGERDVDDETGSYVKTQVVTLLFVPVLALGAYRVIDNHEDAGWYFLGKTKLSSFARTANIAVMLCVAMLSLSIGISAYQNSWDVRAQDKLQAAEALVAANQHGKAATAIIAVSDSIPQAEELAAAKLRELAMGDLSTASSADVVQILRYLSAYEQDPTVIVGRCSELAADRSPAEAFALLDFAVGFDPTNEELAGRRAKLLGELRAAEPDELKWIVARAQDHLFVGEADAAFALLEPKEANLDKTEGALLYGALLARRGDLERGTQLIASYVEPRLRAFEKALKEFDQLAVARQDEIVNRLERNAPRSLQQAYDAAATDAEKSAVVADYVRERLAADPDLRRLQRAYMERSSIVSDALDYGIYVIEHAQTLSGSERDARLAQGEEILLSIQGIAADAPLFLVTMGKVQCWLGRTDQGKEQFEVLLARDRSANTLLAVANAMRDVGLDSDARVLAKEAFEAADSDATKASAATTAGLLAQSADERVEWMQKVGDESAQFQAQLSSALGAKALADGDMEAGQQHLRREIELWAEVPENATTLNNSAQAYFTLYALSGDQAHFEAASAQMDKAVALAPSDGIVLANAASSYFSVAVKSVVGDDFDFAKAHASPGVSSLSIFYNDAAERAALGRKLAAHPAWTKGRTALERARVLSPNYPELATKLVRVYNMQQDADALQKLAAALEASPPDVKSGEEHYRAYLEGTKDTERIQAMDNAIEQRKRWYDELDHDKDKLETCYARDELAELYAQRALFSDDAADLKASVEYAQSMNGCDGNAALSSSLLALGLHEATVSHPALTKLADEFGRALGPWALTAYALGRDDLRDVLLENENVARGLELRLEVRRAFPRYVDGFEYAISRATADDGGAAAQKVLVQSKISDAKIRIARATRGYTSIAVLDHYYLLVARNDPAAEQFIAEQRSLGVRLPPL